MTAVLLAQATYAMGPLFVKGGNAPTWPRQTVLRVQLEAEGVDGLPDPAQVRRAVETAANIWNETAKQLPAADSPPITIESDPAPNIPDGEFSKYIVVRENGSFDVPSTAISSRIIIEDVAGAILQAPGVNQNNLIGNTFPWSPEDPSAGLTGFAIVIRKSNLEDGRSFDWDEDGLVAVLVHEFGHSFNLGHSENPHGILNPLQPDERAPVMYPVVHRRTIGEDDKASLALLYPSAIVADTYVRVSGRVVTADGTFVQNASVILEPVGAGGIGSYSAFTRSNREGRPGEYDLLVLPGRYSVFVENPRFQQERRTQPRIPDNVPELQVDKGKPILNHVIQLP